MNILQLSLQSYPNIGGLETHLLDLMKGFSKRKLEVYLLSYQPLFTNTKWKIYEKKGGIEIFRIPWIADFYYTLIRFPILGFLYLFPGLFIFVPILVFFKKPKIIHAHGLIAGAIAIFWGKLLQTKIIISTHSIYAFPKKGLYRYCAKIIFKSAKSVLCLSEQSCEEIRSLGVPKHKVHKFTYWVDLDRFKKIKRAKQQLGWVDEFTVLFVGRFIQEKGIDIVLKSVKYWDGRIKLVFVGFGPLENQILNTAEKYTSVKLIGKINQEDLPLYYSAADCVIVPSIHEEGFGRVILESLACSTPVIASSRGAIPEVMDSTVGKLINATPENIKKAVEYFFTNKDQLKKCAKNSRSFAKRRFSEHNIEKIIKTYME